MYRRVEDRIKIPRGPQFGRWGAAIYAFLLVFCSIVAIAALFSFREVFVVFFFFVLLGAIFFALMADLQGVEIDLRMNQVRNYKRFWWFVTGKWETLNEHAVIHLIGERYGIRTSWVAEHRMDLYHNYQVILYNDSVKKGFLIGEFDNYAQTKELAHRLADDIRRPVLDNVSR